MDVVNIYQLSKHNALLSIADMHIIKKECITHHNCREIISHLSVCSCFSSFNFMLPPKLLLQKFEEEGVHLLVHVCLSVCVCQVEWVSVMKGGYGIYQHFCLCVCWSDCDIKEIRVLQPCLVISSMQPELYVCVLFNTYKFMLL